MNTLINNDEFYAIISPIYSIQIICCLRCVSFGMDRINSYKLTVIENNDYMTAYIAFIDYISYIYNFIGLGTHLFYPFHIHHRYLYQHAKNTFAINDWSVLLPKLYQCIGYTLIYLFYISIQSNSAIDNNNNSIMIILEFVHIILKMWCLWYITEICCLLSGCTNECDIMESTNQWIWCNNCNKWMCLNNFRSFDNFYSKKVMICVMYFCVNCHVDNIGKLRWLLMSKCNGVYIW